jgi:hypothetical protein
MALFRSNHYQAMFPRARYELNAWFDRLMGHVFAWFNTRQ